MNLLLDPYILAVPSDKSRLETYIVNLYRWTTAISAREHHFWLTSSILNALWETQLYPTWETLHTLESYDSVYNVNTLLRACEAELTVPPLLDELVNNNFLYFEEQETVIVPLAIIERLPSDVASALTESLALAALGRQIKSGDVFNELAFATVSNGFSERELSIDMVTQHIETAEVTNIVHTLEMLLSPDEIAELDELDSIWQDTQRAISYIYRKLFPIGTSRPDCPIVFAGPSFNQNLMAHNLERQPALLFKVLRVSLLGIIGEIPRNQKTHHILHKKNLPVKRGETTAWRLWIEHGSPGWRVHYWLHPDGSVELANLVVHDNFTISEPGPTGHG